MTHDLMDVFIARFPHLATRASEAAEDIAEAEALLDDATAAGLPHVRFAWLALHESPEQACFANSSFCSASSKRGQCSLTGCGMRISSRCA